MIRTTVEADLDRILTCLANKSVNTTTAERYVEFLASRAYRPEWTWIVEEGDRILALSVWWGVDGHEQPFALDCLYADPSVADPVPLWAKLIDRVLSTIPPDAEQPEYHVFLPTGWRSDPAVVEALEPRLRAAAAAGLSGTTERLRYEWAPASGVPAGSGRLTFRAEPDDEAFLDVFRRVAEGSLDAATARGIAQVGIDAAVRLDLELYTTMPGDRAWWRLAYEAGGELVGFAIPSANNGGPVVGYLGVLPEHRGRGYVDDLLAEITAILAATGAEHVRADTDLTNKPMAAAFERAGYRNFAVRMVASRPLS